MLLIFRSSQVYIYLIKGEISSGYLKKISSDIEIVKKKPTNLFLSPFTPENCFLKVR